MVFEGSQRVLAPCEFCGQKEDVDLLYRVSYADSGGHEVDAGVACDRCLELLDRRRITIGSVWMRVLRAF